MPTYLLDASALCKRYFANEIGAGLVNGFFQDVASTRYVLNLAILEVLNAIYRVHREGHLTEAERDAFVAAFYDDITNGRLLVYSVRDDHIIWGVGRWKRLLMEGAFSKRGQDHGKGNRRNPR